MTVGNVTPWKKGGKLIMGGGKLIGAAKVEVMNEGGKLIEEGRYIYLEWGG